MNSHLAAAVIVGTTVREPADIPENLCADEKHTWLQGEKVYAAATVGNSYIPGAAIAEDAGGAALTDAYNVFKKEARCLKPEYCPENCNFRWMESLSKCMVSALFIGGYSLIFSSHLYQNSGKSKEKVQKYFRSGGGQAPGMLSRRK